MKLLKLEIDGKELVLNVTNTSYTVGNIVTIVDIYFDTAQKLDIPSLLRVVVYNENIDTFCNKLCSESFVDLNSLGDLIESMKDFYLVNGLVSKENKKKVYSHLDTGAETHLLDWSDSLSKMNDDPYETEFFKSDLSFVELENE